MVATTVTEDSWDATVLGAADVVIVAICAARSRPCLGFGAVVDVLAAELADTATVVSVDFDENPQVAQRYDVSSLPTVLMFRNGRVIGRFIGARPKECLLREIAPYLE